MASFDSDTLCCICCRTFSSILQWVGLAPLYPPPLLPVARTSCSWRGRFLCKSQSGFRGLFSFSYLFNFKRIVMRWSTAPPAVSRAAACFNWNGLFVQINARNSAEATAGSEAFSVWKKEQPVHSVHLSASVKCESIQISLQFICRGTAPNVSHPRIMSSESDNIPEWKVNKGIMV